MASGFGRMNLGLGGLGARLGGARPQVLRMASSYNRVHTTTLTAGANGLDAVTFSLGQIGSGDCSEIRVLFNNIVWNTTTGPTFTGNPVQIKDVLVNVYGSTFPVRVTIGGSNSYTMADGEIDVLSDPIPPSAIGLAGTYFPKGTQFWTTSRFGVGAGLKLPILEGTDAGTVEGKYFDPTVITPTLTGKFGPTYSGGTPINTFGCAPIIVGKFVSGDPYTWAGFGDSIFANGNQSSYLMRALRTSQLGGIVIGRIGGTAESVNALGCTLTKYVSGAVEEYNTNHVGSRTLAQLQTLSQNAWATIRANAITSPSGKVFKIGRVALLVSTSGAWTAADFSDQTVTANWGAGERAEQFNSWCATQVGVGGGVDFYADVSAQIRAAGSGANFYKWKAPGYTADGLHPGQTAGNALGDAFAALLPV